MVKDKKKILILGAGFAGIRVAQDLAKNLKDPSYEILLIDENLSHVFRGDLYEVATAFNEEITQECLVNLKETVATPIKKLINSAKVRFIHDTILKIDPKKSQIKLKKNKTLAYDYLIVTLGSITNYYNIPGLQENSYPLKTVADALAINCHLDQFFHDLWRSKSEKDVHISVIGGGAAGVETIGELHGSIKKLCVKYGELCNKIHLQLIEGGDTLAGMNKKYTEAIIKRFKKMGIKIYLKTYLTEATKKKITLQNAITQKSSKLSSDITIWTGGVQVAPVVQQAFGTKETRGAIAVKPTLQSTTYKNIFAAGDNAHLPNPHNKKERIPMLAQVAYEGGRHIAKNLIRLINKKPLTPFTLSKFTYVITLGGKYAIWKTRNHTFIGAWCWLARRLVSFKYSLSILPFGKAFKKWHHGSKIFIAND